MGKFFTVLTCRQNFRAAACAGKRWKNKALRNLRVPPEFSCHLPPSGAQLSGTDSPIPPAAGAPPSRSKEKSAGGTRINLVVKTHATFAKELHRAKRVAAEWQERLGPEPSPGKEERAGPRLHPVPARGAGGGAREAGRGAGCAVGLALPQAQAELCGCDPLAETAWTAMAAGSAPGCALGALGLVCLFLKLGEWRPPPGAHRDR